MLAALIAGGWYFDLHRELDTALLREFPVAAPNQDVQLTQADLQRELQPLGPEQLPRQVIVLSVPKIDEEWISLARLGLGRTRLTLDIMPTVGRLLTTPGASHMDVVSELSTGSNFDHRSSVTDTFLTYAKRRGYFTALITETDLLAESTRLWALSESMLAEGGDDPANVMVSQRFDLLIGNDLGGFRPMDQGGARTDDVNIDELSRKLGYSVERSRQVLYSQIQTPALVLLEPTEKQEKSLSSHERFRLGLQALPSRLDPNQQGSVVVYQMAPFSHGDPEQVLVEAERLEGLLNEAILFALERPSTLVVVVGASSGWWPRVAQVQDTFAGIETVTATQFSTSAGSGVLFAYGPGAEFFGGTRSPLQLYSSLRSVLGFVPLL